MPRCRPREELLEEEEAEDDEEDDDDDDDNKALEDEAVEPVENPDNPTFDTLIS